MIKKIVLGLALSGGLLASAPAAVADPSCLLRHGCMYVEEDAYGNNGYWLCPDPGTYLLCDG